MALDRVLQDNFSRGIIRSVEGQRIPLDGLYDAENGLVDDDVGIFRRGGTTYRTLTTGVTLDGLKSLNLYRENKVIAASGTGLHVFADGVSANTTVSLGGPSYLKVSRIIGIGGYAAIRGIAAGVLLYAGSEKVTYAAGGTITATNGSADVTGVGTTFTGNIDKGTLLLGTDSHAVVKSVTDNTNLVLRAPWTGATGTVTAAPVLPVDSVNVDPTAITAAGALPRLLVGAENKVFVSDAGDPFTFNAAEEYHEIPDGGNVIGIEGIGSSVMVFTTTGIWAITNIDYDITDEFGNPQRLVQQINKSLILWNDSGIATYRGGLVAPAADDVYLVDLSGSETPISTGIRPLYRAYVKAGYRPGIAAVHRNHYFLPILEDDDTLEDVLVCRLDSAQPAWTRFSDHAASRLYTQNVDPDTGEVALYGTFTFRVTDLSSCFAPDASVSADADGSQHDLRIVTRDFAVDPQLPNLWKYIRTRYQLTLSTGNPTLTLEYAVGPPELESWTSVGSTLGVATGETSSKVSIGTNGKRAQSIRFRITSTGDIAKLVLRSIELFYRGSGKL